VAAVLRDPSLPGLLEPRGSFSQTLHVSAASCSSWPSSPAGSAAATSAQHRQTINDADNMHNIESAGVKSASLLVQLITPHYSIYKISHKTVFPQ